MIFFYLTFYLALLPWQLTMAVRQNIICYYDAASVDRAGAAQFTLADLENALEFCTHVIYGYAGLNALSLQLTSLHAERDIGRDHFRNVTELKVKYPSTKFLLSMGCDKDIDLDVSNKYIQLLEAGEEAQKTFVKSVVYLLRSYNFDGLDLAFQFPRNNTKAGISVPWRSLRNFFTKKTNNTDMQHRDHKTQFSMLVEKLRKSFKPHDLMLSLTVLPHTNASLYFNASSLINNLDFINLQTFDFRTPELSPAEATYTAPLYHLPVQGSLSSQHNIDYQINYWISQGIPYHKINVGIAAYGRAWKMSKDSQADGFPNVRATNGPATVSYLTNSPGVLAWPEICHMLVNTLNCNRTGELAPLYSVLDPHYDFVTYAYRPADVNGDYGLWLSYDDPRTAAIKAAYVRQRQLGGIALYDVSLDDFHGVCNGDTFPMLRYIKYTFL